MCGIVAYVWNDWILGGYFDSGQGEIMKER